MSSIDIPKADVEQKSLDGVIDLHCHAAPCLLEKLFDEIEIAQQMRQVGYRGVLFKQHLLGANRIPFVRKALPDLAIYGGIPLNHYAGSLNPSAVEAAIAFGAKEVKIPTMHAAFHIKMMGAPAYTTIAREAHKTVDVKGITVFSPEGKIFPEILQVLGS